MSTECQIVGVLADTGGIYWQRWCERNASDLALLTAVQIRQSQRIFSLSDFIAESCINNTEPVS